MRRPGRWLRSAAALVCGQRTVERLIDPIVADIQAEHGEAVRARRRWRAARVCASGYLAFWKAVGLHTLRSGPRALWNGLSGDGWLLGRTIVYSLAAFVGFTLLLSALPMVNEFSRVRSVKLMLLLVPQAVPLSIPIALSLGIVCSGYDARIRARGIRGEMVVAVAAALLAFAAMLAVPMANQAWRVAIAEELGLKGVTESSLPRGLNELSLPELAARSRAAESAGLSEMARLYRRAYHLRFALPAATVVLSLLALGICSVMRGRVPRVAAMVIVIGLYWATLAAAGRETSLPAVLSTWTPNIVFGTISLAVLKIRDDTVSRTAT